MSRSKPAIDLLDGNWYGHGVHDTYDWLRANAPVHHDEANGVWGLTKLEDVAFASKNPQLFCSGQGMRPLMEPPITPSTPSMINMDDPRHKRRRSRKTAASYATPTSSWASRRCPSGSPPPSGRRSRPAGTARPWRASGNRNTKRSSTCHSTS